MRSICFILAGLLLAVTGCDNGGKPAAEGKPQAEKATPDFDEEMLREAGVGTDNASLLAFLRKRSASDADLLGMERLVRQLGSTDFNVRQEASKKLVDLGLIALPPLRQAMKDADQEVARKAKECVDAIVRDSHVNLPLGAVRLLVRRNPPGAVEALLRYLPFVVDEDVEEETWYGLDGIAVREGKLHPALVAAVTDALPARRAVAGCIVARVGNTGQRIEARKLLKDKEPIVRLRTAQGFLAAKEKEPVAIPVLIALLEEPSIHLSWQAEELLHWVAGDRAPKQTLGAATEQLRRECRNAWDAWWRQHGQHLDLSAAESRGVRPGLMFVVNSQQSPVSGKVWLCGCDGKPRWKLATPDSIHDIQLLPPNRLLLAESTPIGRVTERVLQGNVDWQKLDWQKLVESTPNARVAERDLQGNIIWQKDVGRRSPHSCQRLPTGNTLFCVRSVFREILPEGKGFVTSPLQQADGDLVFDDGQKLPNGNILGVDYSDGLIEWNPKTSSSRKWASPPEKRYGLCAQRNGRAFLIGVESNKIYEVDSSGQLVVRAQVDGASWIVPLADEHILVACERPNRIVEVNRKGAILWERFTEVRAYIGPCLPLLRFGFQKSGRPVPVPDSLERRIAALKSPDMPSRRGAILALQKLGAKAEPAIPALLEALGDADYDTAYLAGDVLVSLGKPAFSGLIQALRCPTDQVRELAASCIGEFEEGAEPALLHLIAAIQDPSHVVQKSVVIAIGRIGPRGKSAIPVIASLLQNTKTDIDVRRSAARTLGQLGRDSKVIMPQLLESLKEKDTSIRCSASYGLSLIGNSDHAVVAALIEALEDVNYTSARGDIAFALGKLGPAAKDAVPSLLKVLQSRKSKSTREDYVTCFNVVFALGEMGAAAESAIPALVSFLEDKSNDSTLRAKAALALGSIGTAAKAAIPALTNVLRNDESDVSMAAKRALELIRANK